jgi:hypothetical protein
MKRSVALKNKVSVNTINMTVGKAPTSSIPAQLPGQLPRQLLGSFFAASSSHKITYNGFGDDPQ